jgi:N-acetylglucosaminyl transferase component (Gpi1)
MSSPEPATLRPRSRVLVWPSSLRAADSPKSGFAIGWTTDHLLDTHRTVATSKHCQSQARVIVAGVIPLPEGCIDGDSSLHGAAEKEIRDRLQKLRGDSCFCCRCKAEPSSRRHAPQHDGRSVNCSQRRKVDGCCSGCVRRFCLDNLQVVALYLKRELKAQKSLLLGLPRIVDSNDGFPWWESDVTQTSEVQEERQLVFYDDIGRSKSFCLYRGLFFHDEFLIRLTHASLIIATLDSCAGAFEEDAAKESDPFLTSYVPSSAESSVFSVKTFASRIHVTLSQLSRISLVVCHFLCDATNGNRKRSQLLPVATLTRQRWWNDAAVSHECRIGRCDECRKCTGILRSRYGSAETDLYRADTTLRAILDILCGLTFGAMLYFACLRAGAAEHAAVGVTAYFTIIQRGIAWLGRFPIGFKLNERLTERIGAALRFLLEMNKAWCLVALRWLVDLRLWSFNWVLIPVAGSIVGASGGVAILADTIHLFTFQLSLLSFCFRKMYLVQLYLLAALWRLLRGKKNNVLRKRTDTMEYDSTQLLLGTILFTIVTTLLSTVFVYHLFFAAACVAVEVCLLPFCMLHLLLQRLPAGRLFLRSRTSYFSKDIGLVVHESANSSNGFDVASLVVSEIGYLSIAKDSLTPGFSGIACDLYNGFIGLITGSS